MKRVLNIILIFSFPIMLFAQNFEAGMTFGLVTYHGDLVDNLVEIKEMRLSSGIVLRSVLAEKFSMRANFLAGTLSGKDSYSSDPEKVNRGFHFKTKIYEFSLVGEWNILGTSRSDIRGAVIGQKFTPYLFGGVGAVLFDPDIFQNTLKDPEGRDYPTLHVVVPAGIGFKLGLNERFVLSVELGGRTAFTDYLDGISKLGNPSKNDWYWMGNIMVTYTFGNPSFF
ncbi:MAG TPA: hypothetical protein ENJ53_02420 [Phaeodactylibacter sp.]|nr:hypothetical protein [Phaeodactylibacter sp.]